MTYTEKRLELFDVFLNRLTDEKPGLHTKNCRGHLHDINCPTVKIKKNIKAFLSESITQAEQEMMKKVVEIVNFIDYDFLADLSNEEKYPVEYSINFERKRIRTALSSLDKPLTDNK